MPIPKIDFENPHEKASHDNIMNLQKEMNNNYNNIITANERTKLILQRQFDIQAENMDLLVKNLFDLGDFDKKIPTVKELYSSL